MQRCDNCKLRRRKEKRRNAGAAYSGSNRRSIEREDRQVIWCNSWAVVFERKNWDRAAVRMSCGHCVEKCKGQDEMKRNERELNKLNSCDMLCSPHSTHHSDSTFACNRTIEDAKNSASGRDRKMTYTSDLPPLSLPPIPSSTLKNITVTIRWPDRQLDVRRQQL